MYIKLKNLIFVTQLLITTPFLVWISLYVIKNPDLNSYNELLNSVDQLGLGIEPTLYFFSFFSKKVAGIFGGDPVFIFYFQYIYLLQFFLLLGFYNLIGNIVKSNILLFLWFCIYGIFHGLIQIRFGLANAIFIYIFSLIFVQSSFFKTLILGIVGIFTHYSSILAVSSLFLIRFRKVIYGIESYKIIHTGFIALLLLFKFGAILNFLPEFMLGRLSGYIGNDDVDKISVFSIYISFFCYILLILSPKFGDNKINSLKIYGALGFLPYFIVPELEIIVRLGIPFQYLLLPYLFLTFKLRKVAFFTTLPLLAFFCYKIYSNLNAFIGYL